MDLKALLFDMDGTVVDNMRFHDQTWQSFFAGKGVEIDLEAFFAQTAGLKNPPILRMYLGEGLTDEECVRLSEEKESLYRETYRPHLALHKGLGELMEAAGREGILLAVATSAPPENIEFVLDGLNIRSRFAAVTGGADIEHSKPEPDIYLKSAEKLGVSPEECLVFEDAPIGVESARRAGMPCICISTTMPLEKALEVPGVSAASYDFTPWTLDEIRRVHRGG